MEDFETAYLGRLSGWRSSSSTSSTRSRYGSQFALYALGIALIFGIMGLINFAHGELIMVGAYTIVLIGHPPWPIVRARDDRGRDRLRPRHGADRLPAAARRESRRRC